MCDDNQFIALPERIENAFYDLDDHILATMVNKDEKYAELTTQQEALAKRFPNLISWLENDDVSMTISKEIHAGIVEYLKIETEMEFIARRYAYYAGQKDCFEFLRKINAFRATY